MGRILAEQKIGFAVESKSRGLVSFAFPFEATKRGPDVEPHHLHIRKPSGLLGGSAKASTRGFLIGCEFWQFSLSNLWWGHVSLTNHRRTWQTE